MGGKAPRRPIGKNRTLVEPMAIFEGFSLEDVRLADDVVLRVRHGGSGPAVVLLHGHPRTHTTWHPVAPRLVEAGMTVVCPDLRGYGRSVGPDPDPQHEAYSDRSMAGDVVGLMTHLGHERFALVGHDRGSYVAYRTALDHPERVSRLAVLDSVPIVEALERADAQFAEEWWHWFFFASDQAERVITADPMAWYRLDPAAITGVMSREAANFRTYWKGTAFSSILEPIVYLLAFGLGSWVARTSAPCVLFLDELPEFGVQALDSLRQPLETGEVVVEPSAADLRGFRQRLKDLKREQRELGRLRSKPTRTRDGVDIALQANAESREDVAEAHALGAAGVGLYRTEFLFLQRNELPDEDEQFHTYRDTVLGMSGRPVTIAL